MAALLRYFDVAVLVIAAPIMLLIGVPAGGYLLGAGAWIVFAQELIPPKQDNARSVFRGFFYGRYRTEHVVDLACHVGGQAHVFSRLPVEPPAGDA